MSIDIIYIPFKETECEHNEIRITLRSIEQHCKDLGNLYILGEDYGFYSDKVKLVQNNFDVSEFKYPVVPVKSLYNLVKDNYDEISQNFSLITDNCIINTDIQLETFPNCWKYPLENCGKYSNKKYENLETDTFFASKYLAYGRHMNYETTFPLRFDKERFLNSESIVDFVLEQSLNGIMFKSFLMNLLNSGDKQFYDEKKYKLDSILEIKELYRKGFPVLGMTQQIWSNGGFSFFINEFNKRSSFENHKIML